MRQLEYYNATWDGRFDRRLNLLPCFVGWVAELKADIIGRSLVTSWWQICISFL